MALSTPDDKLWIIPIRNFRLFCMRWENDPSHRGGYDEEAGVAVSSGRHNRSASERAVFSDKNHVTFDDRPMPCMKNTTSRPLKTPLRILTRW